MRSSDWSSDVCSSDLGVIVLLLTLVLPFTSLVAVTSTITLLVFALVNAALWRLHRTGRPEPGVFRAPRWLPPIAAAASLRSEEHTSELQSLMRISYAVFCLKKKN